MFSIKRLKDCTYKESLQAWNQGFEGYFVDIKMTLDQFLSRMGMEELSPDLSLVAFMDDKPVGIVLNGIRTIDGKKVAWNGGTGVAANIRGKGIGKILMEATFEIYREEGVHIATLEAIKQNERAIRLYQSMGYEIVDYLISLQYSGVLRDNAFYSNKRFEIRKCTPQEIRSLSIYKGMMPWQSQWASLRRDGEGLVILEEGKTVGYALYKRTFHESGELSGIILYQCEADPKNEDVEEIVRFGLSNVFAPFAFSGRRMAFNIPASNEILIRVLKEEGFEVTIEQVFMKNFL